MSRVLICVFDALRPEFVTPALMPRLHAFASAGVRHANSRSTFPTETRVNQSAVTTGCLPRRHGVVGNKFIADDLLPGRMVNTGDDAELLAALAAGPVLGMPNLAERLAAAGRSFASLSAGTPGGGRLINHSAEKLGSTRLAMRAPEACCPAGLFDDMVARIGPLPDPTPPAPDWIDWAVAGYLDWIEPEIAPDAMLLWLCEPDETFHWHSIGGPEARGIIAHVDRAFGRILDRLAPRIEAGEMQVIALSDHGQLTITGGRLDLAGKLAEAGFSASRAGLDGGGGAGGVDGGGVDCALALANGGGIWVRDRDAALTARIARWLSTQDWCGPVFTHGGIEGTLPLSALGIDHARAPDIALALATEAEANPHGVMGQSLHDAPYPEGGGCHGGLSAWELHNFLALGGAAFRKGVVIETPAGNIDILPTVMALTGCPVPGDIDGRVLTEAMAGGPHAPENPDTPKFSREVLEASAACLEVRKIGATPYLDRAWRP